MFYISESIDLQTLTPEQIREIVAEEEFDVLATECGELCPGEVNPANWLAFHLPTRRFAIVSSTDRIPSSLALLASIDAGVASLDIDDECKKQGIDQSADDFDSSEIIERLFKEKCEEKEVAVCIAGSGTVPWEDPWEAQILELLTERAAEWVSGED